MRGSEHDKAADVAERHQFMRDAVVYRFRAGDSVQSIAERYHRDVWLVEGILRDALHDYAVALQCQQK